MRPDHSRPDRAASHAAPSLTASPGRGRIRQPFRLRYHFLPFSPSIRTKFSMNGINRPMKGIAARKSCLHILCTAFCLEVKPWAKPRRRQSGSAEGAAGLHGNFLTLSHGAHVSLAETISFHIQFKCVAALADLTARRPKKDGGRKMEGPRQTGLTAFHQGSGPWRNAPNHGRAGCGKPLAVRLSCVPEKTRPYFFLNRHVFQCVAFVIRAYIFRRRDTGGQAWQVTAHHGHLWRKLCFQFF